MKAIPSFVVVYRSPRRKKTNQYTFERQFNKSGLKLEACISSHVQYAPLVQVAKVKIQLIRIVRVARLVQVMSVILFLKICPFSVIKMR